MKHDSKKRNDNVLVVVAHPDDAEFSSGGTIAKWISEGKTVRYVLATKGDKGSANREMTSEKIADLREKEQRSAAEVLGVKDVIFLNEKDGEIENTLKFRERIVRLLRKFRPDIVLTLDPTTYIRKHVYGNYDYINHSDHRKIGEAVLDSIFPSARDHLYFPEHAEEGLEPHKVEYIYLANPEHPNTWVNIEKEIPIKIKALESHQSQFGGHEMNEGSIEKLKDRVLTSAKNNSNGEFQFAEAFRLLHLRPF